MSAPLPSIAVIIPAAGIGKRMQSAVAKQYLSIDSKTVIEHTIGKFVELPFVQIVIVALSKDDTVFSTLAYSSHTKVVTVEGGKERADSVLSGLKMAKQLSLEWVMVHDAARPCVLTSEIVNLYQNCINNDVAGILAVRVKDTMKRAVKGKAHIDHTVSREELWHALTPQCSKLVDLTSALEKQLVNGRVQSNVTDEASALELAHIDVQLVESSNRNIKITEPEDLNLARLFIQSEEL
jgi:2-C-methyl-D-erythritol 4-phosphate cytidylyltransferase